MLASEGQCKLGDGLLSCPPDLMWFPQRFGTAHTPVMVAGWRGDGVDCRGESVPCLVRSENRSPKALTVCCLFSLLPSPCPPSCYHRLFNLVCKSRQPCLVPSKNCQFLWLLTHCLFTLEVLGARGEWDMSELPRTRAFLACCSPVGFTGRVEELSGSAVRGTGAGFRAFCSQWCPVVGGAWG